MDLLNIAAAQEGPSASVARLFLVLQKNAGSAVQDLGNLARQLAGQQRTWALWKQLELASIGPENVYKTLILERSREAGPLQAFALRALAQKAARERKDEDALQLQFDAMEAHEKNKQEEPVVPGPTPPEMADLAATLLLRLISETQDSDPPSESLTLPILGRHPSENVRSAALGAVLQQAIQRNDLEAADEAARHLLEQNAASLEAPMALAARARIAHNQHSFAASKSLLEQRNAYTLTSPWADALRKKRGKDGYPSEERLTEALSALIDWPPEIPDTPWPVIVPQFRAMLKHCAQENPAPGPVTVVIRQEQGERSITNEAELKEPLRSCLLRNAHLFLLGLPAGDWVLHLKATVVPG